MRKQKKESLLNFYKKIQKCNKNMINLNKIK